MRETTNSRTSQSLARIGLPTTISRIAVLIVAGFIGLTAISIETASQILLGSRGWIAHHFDWLFTLTMSVALLVVALFALHPRANVRLGLDDSPPEFSRLSWLAMLLSAGVASGLLYWGTAEPILHYLDSPFLEMAGVAPASEGAARVALRLTIFHWGLHPWALYVLGALAIGVYSYRHGQPLTFRSALYPLLGPRYIDRWPGLTIDLIALFGTVCGLATSVGLASAAMNATLHTLFGLEIDLAKQILVVFVACGLGIFSAVSGVARGIRRLSEVNVWISVGLLGTFVALGPAAFLLREFVFSLGDYLVTFLPMGFWTADSAPDKAWQGFWTVFYWCWFLAWMPFVSLFIARISKGRTVREFVLGAVLVPSLVIAVWFTILGGTALHQELASPEAVSLAVNESYSLGTPTVIDNLAAVPVSTWITAVAAFLLFTWLVTSLDSATLVICHLLETSEVAATQVLWGLVLASATCAVVVAGGVLALQAASIVIGLPIAFVVLAIAIGLLGDLVARRL